MSFVRFLHVLGIGLWLGGGAAAQVVAGMRRGPRPVLDGPPAYAALGRVYAWVVAPGAILATASGLAITMMVASSGAGARLGSTSVALMQGTGLLAGIVEIFIAFPAAQQLARFAAAGDAVPMPTADRRANRMTAASATALTLVIVALLAGVMG